jgi:hypothetical protein
MNLSFDLKAGKNMQHGLQGKNVCTYRDTRNCNPSTENTAKGASRTVSANSAVLCLESKVAAR